MVSEGLGILGNGGSLVSEGFGILGNGGSLDLHVSYTTGPAVIKIEEPSPPPHWWVGTCCSDGLGTCERVLALPSPSVNGRAFSDERCIVRESVAAQYNVFFFFLFPEISKNIKSIAKGVKDSFGNKCAKVARHM